MEKVLELNEMETEIRKEFGVKKVTIKELFFDSKFIKEKNCKNCIFSALDIYRLYDIKEIRPQNGERYGFPNNSISFIFEIKNGILNIKVVKVNRFGRELLEELPLLECKLAFN